MANKIKKVLVSSILISTILISPTILTISCSSSVETTKKYSLKDIGGLNDYFNPGKKQNDKLSAYVKQIRESGTTSQKELLNQKVIQITAGGKTNDESFNQLTWEALSKFSKEAGLNYNTSFETIAISQTQQNDSYDYAIAKGYKIWILTGFQQASLLENWMKIGNNKQRFDELGVKIITVDWYYDSPEQQNLIGPGRLIGLNFKTQESSFVIGYAAAKLVATRYPGLDQANMKKRSFDSFAGGDFSGATNFNYGFYEGLRMWNSEQTSNETKVWVTEYPDLTTGFSTTTDARSKVNNVVEKGAQVIMPVAGPLTSLAIDRIKEKKSSQWVIGVDTDMSLTFPSDKGLLLTSAEKRIGIAIYKALLTLYGLSNYDAVISDFLPQGYSVNPEGKVLNESGQPTNINVVGGYSKGFVTNSKSTLKDESMATEFDQFATECKNKFFGVDGNSGYFEQPENIPQGDYTSQPEWQLNIRNVKYGYMTAGNEKDYFVPACNDINSWKK